MRFTFDLNAKVEVGLEGPRQDEDGPCGAEEPVSPPTSAPIAGPRERPAYWRFLEAVARLLTAVLPYALGRLIDIG